MFRFSIRELLLITLAIGLGIAYLLSWHRERALRTENVRLEWKLRVLESVPTASGKHLSDLVQDDGETLTITSEDGVSTFTPTRAIIQSADGGKGVATWNDPYAFPPPRKVKAAIPENPKSN